MKHILTVRRLDSNGPGAADAVNVLKWVYKIRARSKKSQRDKCIDILVDEQKVAKALKVLSRWPVIQREQRIIKQPKQ